MVLSAQATDVGVNKATGPLFDIVDTPEKMVALGEAKLRDHIKTIGLYRNKAKNVIALAAGMSDGLGFGDNAKAADDNAKAVAAAMTPVQLAEAKQVAAACRSGDYKNCD